MTRNVVFYVVWSSRFNAYSTVGAARDPNARVQVGGLNADLTPMIDRQRIGPNDRPELEPVQTPVDEVLVGRRLAVWTCNDGHHRGRWRRVVDGTHRHKTFNAVLLLPRRWGRGDTGLSACAVTAISVVGGDV
jgi:hypothetical protein